jgi:hypothetical protein
LQVDQIVAALVQRVDARPQVRAGDNGRAVFNANNYKWLKMKGIRIEIAARLLVVVGGRTWHKAIAMR